MNAQSSQPTMGTEQDIIDMLLEAIESNGSMDKTERDKRMLMAFTVLIKQMRRLERASIAATFARNPIKVSALIMLVFVLLHEFATYINIGVIITATLRILGVPIN